MRAFRCARTGLLYPEDYVENWGIKYGFGLGPTPVSEALINDYNTDPPRPIGNGKTFHPIKQCQSQMDFMDVTPEEYAAHLPVLMKDDPDYSKRAVIMRDKQLVKEGSLLSRMYPDEIEDARTRLTRLAEDNLATVQKNIQLTSAKSVKTDKKGA